jgi:integrase
MAKRKKEPEIRLPKIKQLPSGAWHTRVLIEDRRVSITKDTYDECVAEYLALKNGLVEVRGKKDGKDITLEEAVKSYIAAKEGFLSPSTIAGYEKFKRNMLLGMMKRNIFAVSNDQWQAAIRQEHKAGKSPKYIKNGWMFFSACIVAAGAPRPEVMLYPPEHKERAYLTPDEIDKFVEAIKGHRFEIPYLMCLSSLRRSEMIAMDWANVDLENKVMHVRGAIVRGTNGLVEKPQTKTEKSRRSVPIIPPLLEALKQQEPKTGRVVGSSAEPIRIKLKCVCTSAGITVVDLHGLRHSFASLAYHLGIPEMIAAEIGGWNDLSTMHNIYTHLAQKDIAKRSQEFCDWFSTDAVKMRKLATGLEIENKFR